MGFTEKSFFSGGFTKKTVYRGDCLRRGLGQFAFLRRRLTKKRGGCFEEGISVLLPSKHLLLHLFSKYLLEKGVKYFNNKVNNSDTRMRLLMLILTIFQPFSIVFIIEFEQVLVYWLSLSFADYIASRQRNCRTDNGKSRTTFILVE